MYICTFGNVMNSRYVTKFENARGDAWVAYAIHKMAN